MVLAIGRTAPRPPSFPAVTQVLIKVLEPQRERNRDQEIFTSHRFLSSSLGALALTSSSQWPGEMTGSQSVVLKSSRLKVGLQWAFLSDSRWSSIPPTK